MGKSTISIAIFHCYVSSPEGKKKGPKGPSAPCLACSQILGVVVLEKHRFWKLMVFAQREQQETTSEQNAWKSCFGISKSWKHPWANSKSSSKQLQHHHSRPDFSICPNKQGEIPPQRRHVQPETGQTKSVQWSPGLWTVMKDWEVICWSKT